MRIGLECATDTLRPVFLRCTHRLRSARSLFMAGSETTAKALSWTLYYLGKHPEMLRRCREEALRVAPLRYGFLTFHARRDTAAVLTAAPRDGYCWGAAPPYTMLWATSNHPLPSAASLYWLTDRPTKCLARLSPKHVCPCTRPTFVNRRNRTASGLH